MKTDNGRVEPLKKRLLKTIQEMRLTAKKGHGTRNEAKAFWVGYDQACFEIHQKLNP